MPLIDFNQEKPYRATKKQTDYLEVLIVDLNFSIKQRNAYISDKIGRNVSHLDELSSKEASVVIDYFKTMLMKD